MRLDHIAIGGDNELNNRLSLLPGFHQCLRIFCRRSRKNNWKSTGTRSLGGRTS
jgi:hypothetical protein